jgi:hypothetical protein
MTRSRITHYFVLGLSFLTAPWLLADDAATAAKSLEPLQILEECVRAIQARDFARYVDHLSKEEQQAQAGYALYVASMIARSADTGVELDDPETILLGRSLKGIVEEHRLTVVTDSQAYQRATQARNQILCGPYTPAAPSGSYGGPTLYLAVSPTWTRETFITSTGVLTDPRQFLIAVLTEVSRPTIVSGHKQSASQSAFDFDEYAKSYSGVQWTVYTRGDYAIAVSADAKDAGEQAAPVQAEAGPVLAQGSQVDMPSNIGFRRINGVWKIDCLLPNTALNPQPVSAPVMDASIPTLGR